MKFDRVLCASQRLLPGKIRAFLSSSSSFSMLEVVCLNQLLSKLYSLYHQL